ncbi:hypothetical protein MMC08_005086 [Hypocenomyce scalaris]|nr:hypothetical protein [Hypocenomyce scalaris]
MPQHELLDTEARWIYGKTPLTAELVASFEAKALAGLTLIQDRSRDVPVSLLPEPVRFRDNEFRAELPADYVYWVLGSRKDCFDAANAALRDLDGRGAAQLSRELTAHWHPSFHALFALQDPARASLLRIYSDRPRLLAWESAGRVTLVGDAAHVMPPTAGVGATTALQDADCRRRF